MGPTWGHLGPTGPRWAPCWPHEPCYPGWYWLSLFGISWVQQDKGEQVLLLEICDRKSNNTASQRKHRRHVLHFCAVCRIAIYNPVQIVKGSHQYYVPTFRWSHISPKFNMSSCLLRPQHGNFNPLRANFFRGNRNIYLHFMPFLHVDMT